MPTTLTNGIQLPDKGSVDWYSSMQSNYNLIDTHLGDTDIHVTAEDKANWDSKQGSLSQAQLDAIAQVATNTSDIATLQSGKANASHTHSSSDITDIGDYATKQYVDNSISGLVDNAPDALNTLNELSAALNDDSNFASTVTTALGAKANSADLATVATSGSYTDLTDKPTIPTNTSDLTNDSDFVVSSNLATIATSGDYDDLSNKPSIPTNTSDLNNDSGFVTLNDFDIPAKTSDLTNDSGFITSSDVPTGTSDLINDSNFVDTSNPAVASGITSTKVTDYDAHIADTDIHVTTADKNKWNNQTYVFRYSSTALVASSTNSNTLLDNTDNLKVGDKVIDSDGVLFSITAIDTANSTFTIGTALIDLALDANVMHLSGNETVDGYKTFSKYITSDGSVAGDEYTSNAKTNLWLMGNRDVENVSGILFDTYRQNTAQGTGIHILGLSIKENSVRYEGCRFGWYWDNSLNGYYLDFKPTTQGAHQALKHNLGTSTDKWSEVHGVTYYYGSSDTEFSDKFVTTDTAQTVSGSKTFSDLQIISYGTQYKGARNAYILPDFAAGYSGLSIATLGYSQTLKIGNFVLDANNKPSLDASKGYVQFAVGDNNNVNTCILEPKNIIASSLGTSANKWSEIHGTEYYYGSNNVEFSTKFVTTDTAQTISGAKTFSDNLTIYNSDDTQTPKGLVIKNAQWGMGESGGVTASSINFLDKNSVVPASIIASKGLYGQSFLRFSVRTKDSQNNTLTEEIYYNIDTSGNVSFRPWHDNTVNLGASIYKWKDVQTYQINSLEPSSLSLPSGNANDVIDISSYLTYLDGTDNTYVAPSNGWITINMNNCSGIHAAIAGFWGDSRVRASAGAIKFLMPVLKNQTVTLTIHGGTINNARFIPCQGNV